MRVEVSIHAPQMNTKRVSETQKIELYGTRIDVLPGHVVRLRHPASRVLLAHAQADICTKLNTNTAGQFFDVTPLV